MLLQFRSNVKELSVSLRHVFLELLDFLGVADARNHVLALCIEQEVAVHDPLTGGGIAGEGHACTRIIARVAKDHGLDVDSSAQIMRNVGCVAIINGAFSIPRVEHSFNCQF